MVSVSLGSVFFFSYSFIYRNFIRIGGLIRARCPFRRPLRNPLVHFVRVFSLLFPRTKLVYGNPYFSRRFFSHLKRLDPHRYSASWKLGLVVSLYANDIVISILVYGLQKASIRLENSTTTWTTAYVRQKIKKRVTCSLFFHSKAYFS